MVLKSSSSANNNVVEKYPVKIIGKVFSDPAIAMLSVTEVGAFTVLANHLLRNGQHSIHMDDAVEVLQVHGMAQDAAGFTLKALKVRGIIDITTSGKCQIHSVHAAIESGKRELDARKTAWAIRAQNTQVVTEQQVYIESEATQERESAPETQPIVEKVRREAAPEVEIKVTEKKAGSNDVRISDSNNDTSEVAVVIPCKAGVSAHITKDYVESLKKLYPGVDVQRELMLAAKWCVDNDERKKTVKGVRRFMSTWLNNAMQARSIQMAVSASAKTGSFGNGKDVSRPIEVKDLNDGLDFVSQ